MRLLIFAVTVVSMVFSCQDGSRHGLVKSSGDGTKAGASAVGSIPVGTYYMQLEEPVYKVVYEDVSEQAVDEGENVAQDAVEQKEKEKEKQKEKEKEKDYTANIDIGEIVLPNVPGADDSYKIDTYLRWEISYDEKEKDHYVEVTMATHYQPSYKEHALNCHTTLSATNISLRSSTGFTFSSDNAEGIVGITKESNTSGEKVKVFKALLAMRASLETLFEKTEKNIFWNEMGSIYIGHLTHEDDAADIEKLFAECVYDNYDGDGIGKVSEPEPISMPVKTAEDAAGTAENE